MSAQADSARLPAVLDMFRAKYNALRILPDPIDLTDAYWSVEAQRHVAPRSYGTLPQDRVMGYVAFGGTLIAKFAKDETGRVMRRDGVPVIADFRMEQEVMACLCLYDMRNTSLYEIGDALEGTHGIQGYRRWHHRTLSESVRRRHPGFSSRADSCFLFAGEAAAMRDRIALNACWLRLVSQLGAGSLEAMSAQEALMMQRVFPAPVLEGDRQAIRERSYMWGRPLWEPLSAAFLASKVAARRAFLAGAAPRLDVAAAAQEF